MDLPAAEPDINGLSWAFAFPPGGPPVAGPPRPRGEPGWDWLHFDLIHSRARACIEAEPDIPAFALPVLTGADETPRILCDGEAVAGVLPSFVRSEGLDAYDICWWRFAMRPDRLLTGRRRPARTLVGLWETVRAGASAAGPAALLYRGIAEFARDARRRVAVLDDGLDASEDTLLDQSRSANLGGLSAQVGQARREATIIRRALTPLARLLGEDAEEWPSWAMDASHDATRNTILSALDDIAALHDRARSLQDELTARLAEETNQRLYIVSVVTTIVMPATLVTGFFGMNTGNMLWAEIGHGTAYAFCTCVIAMIGTLLLLRWKRLL